MKQKYFLLYGLLFFFFHIVVFPLTADTSIEDIPLRDDLGDHQYSISTNSVLAQQYFTQGLIQSYGFNHAEAVRSFQKASRLDPKCAMCYWGEALALGPNINAPMDDVVVSQAYKAAQKALSLVADQATIKEKALIQALEKRYSNQILENRRHFDKAYADAMRLVYQDYPNDGVIGSLLAEALMDLHPWNFWKKSGEAQPWTQEIVHILDDVLKNDPDNPLTNHLYIHIMEASPYPEKALPSAERLATLVPGSGHLVHMPAHIYIRIGRYRDAALVNKAAVKVDQHYLDHAHVESIYTTAYIPHNFHFLWAAAAKTGQYKVALQAAIDTAGKVKSDAMRDKSFAGTSQHFWLMPIYTKLLFGQWEDILLEPMPPEDLPYVTGIWHYARGMVFLRQGKLERAQLELSNLLQVIANPAVIDLKIFDLNEVGQILQIAQAILEGEIAAAQENYAAAVEHLKHAVTLEDGLNYTEPKDWYLPPRQVLGAILLVAGKADQAEQVYREDLDYHPQSGWSLYGLVQALRAQEKTTDAETTQKQFNEAWTDADIELLSSRF